MVEFRGGVEGGECLEKLFFKEKKRKKRNQ